MPDADRVRWDARHVAEGDVARAPPAWLEKHDDLFPREGRALDVAAGRGRISRWAAARGLRVTSVDISPVGLATLRRTLPGVQTVVRDLELEARLPRGPFALVSCFDYRQPSLFPAMVSVLGPGGILVAAAATVKNLARHERPSRRWLMETGELEGLAAGLELLVSEEGWSEDGRHRARIIARKAFA